MKKKNFLKSDGVQSFVASIICIILGLLIGFIVLLLINAKGAPDAMLGIIKNFFKWKSGAKKMENFGVTLVKTAPLLMCSLSILFSYKVGLFNIGVAGQYVAGACAALYGVFGLHWNWLGCLLLAALAGAAFGAISGLLKAYCNVNEVISGIMLNWIALYTSNMILANYLTPGRKDTPELASKAEYSKAIIPSLGLGKLFNDNKYVGLAIIISIIFAFAVWILLSKTKFGYELKATGYNKNAAKYAGMAEKRNIVVTLAIGGLLAGIGASLLFLTDFSQWDCNQTSVPAMGFNGIAAAFLGGLNPIGAIFSSFFIQHITDGGSNVDLTMYCAQISDLISAIIIYLCGFTGLIKYLFKSGIFSKKDEKNAVNANAEPAAKPAGPADAKVTDDTPADDTPAGKEAETPDKVADEEAQASGKGGEQ
ncbi:MAG: ABC transporter permease [Lachnospiraceae bacterium]|nr:ABC transporter permease [Lachnospiraceae bacterium]